VDTSIKELTTSSRTEEYALYKQNEEDERYRYLLKNGIVRRVEDEDKIIFAELPQIPGVLVVYRKPSERNANPDRLNLDKRELTHMPLLEGEEKLRLLNL
jgi:leucine-rich repeat-containing protein 49